MKLTEPASSPPSDRVFTPVLRVHMTRARQCRVDQLRSKRTRADYPAACMGSRTSCAPIWRAHSLLGKYSARDPGGSGGPGRPMDDQEFKGGVILELLGIGLFTNREQIRGFTFEPIVRVQVLTSGFNVRMSEKMLYGDNISAIL